MADPPHPPDPFALQPVAPSAPAGGAAKPAPLPLPPPQQPQAQPQVSHPPQMQILQPVPVQAWPQHGAPFAPPKREIQHSPGFRNLIHVGMFFFIGLPLIFLGRFLIWLYTHNAPPDIKPQAVGSAETSFGFFVAGLGVIATLFNAFVLRRTPVLGKLIVRPDEGVYNGVWIYPCALAVCFLLFPLYAAFGAWAVLACGDAAASYVGRLVPAYKLSWNNKKTYAGLLGFVCCAVFGVYVSLYLMPCRLFSGQLNELRVVWTLAVLASLAGAIAESIDTKIDDNVRVPFAAAAALVLGAYFLKYSTQNLGPESHVQPQYFIHALIANAVLGALVLFLRFADFPGTLVGMVLGTIVYFYAGWQGYVLFVLFVGLGSTLSKLGMKRKKELHAAEPNEGKRSVGNVVANLLVATLCCLAYPLLGRPSLLIAFAGALAAALADTASSELGVLSPKEPWLVTTFKPVKHGTNGAVSVLGSAAAFAASGLVAGLAAAIGFVSLAAGRAVSWPALVAMAGAIFCGGLFGTAIDSLLGATIEGKAKGLRKGTVNFICTLVGAVTAGAAAEVWMWLGR